MADAVDPGKWRKSRKSTFSRKSMRKTLAGEEELNLESVLLYHEEIPSGHERHLANNLDHAFAPCRFFMLLLLRFPLVLHVRQDYSREFTYSWKSFRGWMFFITGFIMTLNVILIAMSLMCALLDFPPQSERFNTSWYYGNDTGRERPPHPVTLNQEQLRVQELFLLQRNFVPMVMLLLSLCHVCLGDVSLFFRRNFISKYFTFWDEAVEIMKMDAGKHPENVRKFMFGITTFYAAFLVIFLGLAAVNFAPLATGAPAQLAILWNRFWFPEIHAWKHFRYVVYAACPFYIYMICTSKAYVLLFLYKCKILKNAFAIWNERMESVLHKGGHRTRREQCETRTGFDHLFRDYVVLLDLLRGADTMFTHVIESYYGTQVFSLCFEVYYLVRSVTAHEEFTHARKLDAVLITIYLFHSLIMLFVSSTGAADVGEKAMEGLEIIRRKGFIGRKTNQEMYFTLSLYMSYTGHFETALTAGRFVIFDRGFVVALVGTIFSYFIILIQFTPPLAMLDQDKLNAIDPQQLVMNVENTFQHFDEFKIGFDTLANATL